ncbi:MAG: deoxyribodipyrimidine photolyase-related protein [Halioglobus sp.]|jgi:deoxyribodipyrimidine photolyase-related protein
MLNEASAGDKESSVGQLILLLGDQLNLNNAALEKADASKDVIVMAEVSEEANYVPHSRHKMVLLFSAMRHFRARLLEQGFTVIYFTLEDDVASLTDAIAAAAKRSGIQRLVVAKPGEYRVLELLQSGVRKLDIDMTVVADTRFLINTADFTDWISGYKQPRMEYFYRVMRKRYGILLDEDGKPAGGRWNYDKENRKGWRGKVELPQRLEVARDDITERVMTQVLERFADHPGDLAHFRWAVTHEQAQAQFDWFCTHALPDFGTWQDAMADDSPWMFHSLISAYLNIGLLDPLQVCRQVQACWESGHCELNAAEGFIRQVLGWREYVRGLYWQHMPGYRDMNGLAAHRQLPGWFWTGSTDMHCLHKSIGQSLDRGYGHHIQRLMVIGNFALLAGLDVKAVCDWFLAVYIDAYEWVELPNTLGMALFADAGIMASKPYAASGKYIQRQSDYCQHCRYDPSQMTGAGACPYNSLYWRFIDRHKEAFSGNSRMQLVLANWRKKEAQEREAILHWAEQILPEVVK